MSREKVFKPVWQCIYCGTVDGKLGKEHIIPYGLGGSLILPRSSCTSCSKITGKIEQFCLRDMLGTLRIRHNVKTRHKHERPTKFQIREIDELGGDKATITIFSEDLPFHSWSLPIFDSPTAVMNWPVENTWDNKLRTQLGTHDAAHLLNKGSGKQPIKIRLGKYHHNLFCRFLAKVAHSYAVAKLGVTGFVPSLIPLILEDHSVPNLWIGGIKPIQAASNNLWSIALGFSRDRIGGSHILVRFRFFGYLGTPEYIVTVGHPATS